LLHPIYLRDHNKWRLQFFSDRSHLLIARAPSRSIKNLPLLKRRVFEFPAIDKYFQLAKLVVSCLLIAFLKKLEWLQQALAQSCTKFEHLTTYYHQRKLNELSKINTPLYDQ